MTTIIQIAEPGAVHKPLRQQANEFSFYLLDRHPMEGKKLLDAGSGETPDFCFEVVHRGGIYVPVDKEGVWLDELQQVLEFQGLPYNGKRADLRELPFDDSEFFFYHGRWVYQYLDLEGQISALREAARVTSGLILIIETASSTVASTTHSEIVGRYQALTDEMAELSGVTEFTPESLLSLAQSSLPGCQVQSYRAKRAEGDYTEELLAHCDRCLHVAEHHMWREKASELSNSFRELLDDIGHQTVLYSPPDLVAAVINVSKP